MKSQREIQIIMEAVDREVVDRQVGVGAAAVVEGGKNLNQIPNLLRLALRWD